MWIKITFNEQSRVGGVDSLVGFILTLRRFVWRSRAATLGLPSILAGDRKVELENCWMRFTKNSDARDSEKIERVIEITNDSGLGWLSDWIDLIIENLKL